MFRDRGMKAPECHPDQIGCKNHARNNHFFLLFFWKSVCSTYFTEYFQCLNVSSHELILQLKTHPTTLTVQGINVTSLVRVLRCPSWSVSCDPQTKYPEHPLSWCGESLGWGGGAAEARASAHGHHSLRKPGVRCSSNSPHSQPL